MPKKVILLADDDANIRLIVRITLEGPETEILETDNGATALEQAREQRPHLIILDWMMPEMSGIEAAEALRKDPDTADIPIMMLTSKRRAADLERGRNVGVFAYLIKPFSPLELIQTVETVLGEDIE